MIQNPLCPTLSAPKKMLQGGFGGFHFYEIATAADGFGFKDNKRISGIMTKGSLQGILVMRRKLPLCAGIHWRRTGIHWVWSLARYPLGTRQYPLDTGIWRGREIPANSILAAASKKQRNFETRGIHIVLPPSSYLVI
jgi:hypothetical protein